MARYGQAFRDRATTILTRAGAAGYNIRWLLQMILKKRVGLYFVLIRLLVLGGFDQKTPFNQLEGSATAQLSLSSG
jgi:hypothetical protein